MRRAAAILLLSIGGGCLDAPAGGGGKPGIDAAALDAADGDGSGGDAADPADAADDGNLVFNGDFEAGTLGWVGLRADIGEEVILVHGGAKAAWACLDAALGSGATYRVDIDDNLPAPADGTYGVEAWVRAQTGASAQKVAASVRLSGGDVDTSPEVAATNEWVFIGYEARVTGGGSLTVRVRAESVSAGDCFLVDDVVLTRR